MRDEFVPVLSQMARTGGSWPEDSQSAFSADAFIFTSNGGEEAIYNELLEIFEDLRIEGEKGVSPRELKNFLAAGYQTRRRQSLHCLLVEGDITSEELEPLLAKLRALPDEQRVAAELYGYSLEAPYIGGVFAFHRPSDRSLDQRSITAELQARLDDFFLPWALLQGSEFSVRALPAASMRLKRSKPEHTVLHLDWSRTQEDELLNLLVPSTF